MQVIGYAAKSAKAPLKPFAITRAEPKPNQVQIDIMYCGVCHSDIHQVKNEWDNTIYPCMPGHEIVGRVEKIGAKVTKFKVGDLVGVGCMVDSCHECPSCLEGLENYCDKGFLATYNGNMRDPKPENQTYGGYSDKIVVREDFVLTIPPSLKPEEAAPILCAGVTTYSPLKHWNVGPETKVGVIGLGGLGHMAVKIAVAMGAEVTVLTTSEDKRADAKKLGAKKVIIETDKDELEKNEKTLDFIISTIPQPHDTNPFTKLLKRDGVLTIVGCIAPLKKPIDISEMITDRRSLATSLIGSIKETQEVLDFCARHAVAPSIQVIPIDEVNEVYEQVDNRKADFRYVIDMSTLGGVEEHKGLLGKLGL